MFAMQRSPSHRLPPSVGSDRYMSTPVACSAAIAAVLLLGAGSARADEEAPPPNYAIASLGTTAVYLGMSLTAAALYAF
jgi:hypothetical protein